MDRLEAFEQMLADLRAQYENESRQLEQLRSEGKEKTATFRQLLGNRMLLKAVLEKYREHGLMD